VPWALAALTAAVVVPVAIRGGFTPVSRAIFVGLAAVSIAALLVADERSVRRTVGEPVVLTMLGLALVAIVSAAWTTGTPADAVRWGLVVAAYAATAAVGAKAAQERGVASIALLICALAAVEATIGLVAAGLRVEPFAERINGSWRPGGTFEYPPALALVGVFALPGLLRGAASRRAASSLASAAALAVVAGAIGLAGSRTEIALAVVVVVAAVTWPERTIGASRTTAILAMLLAAGSALAMRLALGGYAFPGATEGDAGRLVLLAAIPAVAVGSWYLVTRLATDTSPRDARRIRWGTGTALAAIAIALIAIAAAQRTGGPWTEPSSGFSHGREDQWRAAVDTALDHPVLGAGAEAYLRASVAHQGSELSRYAHDLPLEAWAELGPVGLALTLALLAFAGRLLWRVRGDPRAWLVAPAVAAFLLANLVDWPWHLAGVGALWAAALGGCLAIEAGLTEPA
jgi:O-antigen ligase